MVGPKGAEVKTYGFHLENIFFSFFEGGKIEFSKFKYFLFYKK